MTGRSHPRRPLPPEARHDMSPSDPFDKMLYEMMVLASVEVAPGVRADVYDNGAWVEVRAILADPENRVRGAVGAWLDSLPRDRRVIVPAVTSRTVCGMLLRRDFECVVRWDDKVGMWDEGAMTREAVSG